MRESMWGVFVITVGVVLILIIYLFQGITNADEHNYYLLKEVTEASLLDAVDVADYRVTGNVSINREKFVEVFVRRFAESADLSNSYVIEIYDINEEPPKVSLLVKTKKNGAITSETVEFDITNRLDAILETVK
ncbi:MAG: hypothetical protein E7165_04325 [Firmicutes bacterium]|nr:hypothetical protein [Bacillota bacterium]